MAAHVAAQRARDAGAVDRRAVLAGSPLPVSRRRGGRCTIYEVRPLSLPRDELARRRRMREAAARPDGAGGVPGGRGAAAIRSWSRSAPSTRSAPASSSALSELHGLDMRPLDLIAALHLLLERARRRSPTPGSPAARRSNRRAATTRPTPRPPRERRLSLRPLGLASSRTPALRAAAAQPRCRPTSAW